ncbi:acetyl-CoA carboxylase biotin carboxyl carrier protein [Paenibacillus agricola]|uniref:Biotin carboxyl carrier protein of acetyl-CoA carboxylase n=1 Tax=Paenibacillus agricola TaxID=2716264 RepID=A0ABX0IZ59_9BACL|nr:acetyl-CoA carboxylase biotin carboxyl carrier protein [Paenibacillus agricola]NHN28836.1 acetyl-CoA carboxylase biotin carboxyl carrier protein [Paenibacillus agricola]
MFKLNEIKELIKLIDQSSLQELEIENEGSRLLIRKPNKTESVVFASSPVQHSFQHSTPQSLPQNVIQAHNTESHITVPDAPIAPAANANLHKIVSPMVGTFYTASSPGAADFVDKGSQVKEKSVVCIIEAMKLMNEIEAEIKGEIVEILAENGQLVEYGQPLFLVKPE